MNDPALVPEATYFQYVSNRSAPFGPQVFFWFSDQGGTSPVWLQFITNYEQAGEIAKWLGLALNYSSPDNLTLSLSGATLSFSSTKTTMTISGDDGQGTTLSGTFAISDFGWMISAVIFSIQAMVMNNSDFAQGAVDHPLVRKVLGR